MSRLLQRIEVLEAEAERLGDLSRLTCGELLRLAGWTGTGEPTDEELNAIIEQTRAHVEAAEKGKAQ